MKQNNDLKRNQQEEEESKQTLENNSNIQINSTHTRLFTEPRTSQYILLQSPFKPVERDTQQIAQLDLNQPNINDSKQINLFDRKESTNIFQDEHNLEYIRYAVSKNDRQNDLQEEEEDQDKESRNGLFRFNNNILDDLYSGDQSLVKKIIVKGLEYVPYQQYIDYIDLNDTINVEKFQQKHKLKEINYLYLLQVSYSNYKWMIRRTLEQVKILENQYIKFMKQMGFENIEKEHLTLEQSQVNDDEENDPRIVMGQITDNIRMIVNQFDFELSGVDPLLESKNMGDFTQKQMNLLGEFKNNLRAFLEFSDIFEEGKQKHKEVFVYKRAGGRYKQSLCSKLSCKDLFGCYTKRYFLISQEGVMYTKGLTNPDSILREVILFDYNFEIEYGKKTGSEFGNLILTQQNQPSVQLGTPKPSFIRFILNMECLFVFESSKIKFFCMQINSQRPSSLKIKGF